MPSSNLHFWPSEGALLDLASLRALAEEPGQALDAVLRLSAPGAPGLVLAGLELVGAARKHAPPGSVSPDPMLAVAVVSAGVAIARDDTGHPRVVSVPAPVEIPWPDATGAGVRGAIVLRIETPPARTAEGLTSAAREIVPRVGFAALERMHDPGLLPLAVSLGNGRDWANDLARVWQPEDRAIRGLVDRLSELEALVWAAEPEGGAWDSAVRGRTWVRYQTVAAAALHACLTVLETRATTTIERVRLLEGLRRRLHQSVESAATELVQDFVAFEPVYAWQARQAIAVGLTVGSGIGHCSRCQPL
jgi:hypothetical protein